ncbi:unnamed protein product, partial [Meganyctiphanes norvegica]
KDVASVNSAERERTKRVVYAVLYGVGKDKIADVLQIDPQEAREIIHSFMKTFPTIPAFTRQVIETCQRQGFLTTIFNRRRLFPRINTEDIGVRSHTERKAVNFIIQ